MQLKVNGFLSEPFNVSSGVKQGCALGAFLYVFAISLLLKKRIKVPVLRDIISVIHLE